MMVTFRISSGYNSFVRASADAFWRLQADIVKALQIYFKVPVEVRREDGRFIASCFLLDSTQEGPSKHETLAALTDAVQQYMTACCNDRTIDDLLHRHNLHLPGDNEELVTGHYIDVAIQLKIPGLDRN